MQEIWRVGNLGLLFLVELAGLGIFAWWGWRTGPNTPVKLLLAIGLPLVAAVIWGLFAAPKADYGSPVVTAVVKVAFFGLAVLALWSLDHWVLGAVFLLVVVANFLAVRLGHLTV
ncbi:YrdB family protein [Kribbella sp. NPDC006257]|uniref:YrdB family protein n=1 Tax=Kribbella sp. NPDC006257 TaxID=3156738 RepID=UPI0033BE64F1